MNIKKGYYFLFWLLLALGGVRGQGPVRYLGIENGLSNNAVMHIFQDHRGFMWFGTYDGLNRYDGYGFKVFHNVIGDSTSLSINNIYTIEEDDNRALWVGGQKGLSVYNTARSGFSRVRYLSVLGSLDYVQDNIHVVQAAGPGCILVGTQHNGLLAFQSSTKAGLQIPLSNKVGEGGNIGGEYDASAIEYGPGKAIWVFIQNEGLYSYDAVRKRLDPINGSIKQANCLRRDKRGRLWLGTDNGLYQYDLSSNTFSPSFMPSRVKITSLCVDKKNVLWVGSDGAGVWLLPDGTSMAQPLLTSSGRSVVNSNSIYTIYEDIEGRKWIGTLRGGVNIIDPGKMPFVKVTYDSPSGSIADNFILSFCEGEKDKVWIGTDGGGLRYWDRIKNSYVCFRHESSNPNSISSNFITSIMKDYLGDLWISTWFGGINRMKGSSGSFERYTCVNPVTNSEENNIWQMYEDSQKRLWAGTTNEGCLYLYDRASNQFELFDKNITNLQCLAEDSAGNFWGGNYTTLIRIDRLHKKHLTYNIGYPVRCIHEDRYRNFWLGTQGGGLLLFDRQTGQFIRYTTRDGLPSNTLLRFEEDRDGYLWISTFGGLSRFDPRNKVCQNFTQSDGLQSNQFSFNASVVLRSGEFLFGGIKGFNVFYPDSTGFGAGISGPALFLDGLRINNKPVEEDSSYVTRREVEKIRQITVPFEKAILSLDYLALSYAGVDKIKYAYYLEGWDKDWNYVNDSRTANYSKLGQGRYTFKIKVSNSDGKWSPATELLEIVILPPWYQTWWAYLLYILLFAGSIYLYISYARRQERLRYEIKLAHLESEKEKNLSERKLSFFTNISHEFRSPLTLIIDPLKRALGDGPMSRGDLAIAHRNARRLLSLVDQLLLFRKADSGADVLKISVVNIVALCNEVYQCFVHQATSRNIDYRFMASGESIEIQGDYEKIEIALFNLLSNAFKFTPAGGSILFDVAETGEGVQIGISDTGPGIDEADIDRIFGKFQQVDSAGNQQTGFGIGLYLVKNFIERHQGTVVCRSKAGEGATFTITLLKELPHLTDAYIIGGPGKKFELLEELMEEEAPDSSGEELLQGKTAEEVVTEKRSILVIDDNEEIRDYLLRLFAPKYLLYSADNGTDGFRLAEEHVPDLVISDINMKGMDGIELCTTIKQSENLGHIPVILLTAATTPDTKLKGIEGGADDYITKPFDSQHLLARVEAILRNRNMLQRYFLDSITLKESAIKVPAEYQEFLRKCISVIEENIDNEEFTMKKFSQAMGMSHSRLNQKVKAISGQRLNAFIRSIRLRRAAVLMLTENMNISQAAFQVGISDARYFREQFVKIFGMTPSDYIKKYRDSFNKNLNIIRENEG